MNREYLYFEHFHVYLPETCLSVTDLWLQSKYKMELTRMRQRQNSWWTIQAFYGVFSGRIGKVNFTGNTYTYVEIVVGFYRVFLNFTNFYQVFKIFHFIALYWMLLNFVKFYYNLLRLHSHIAFRTRHSADVRKNSSKRPQCSRPEREPSC